MSVLLAIVAGVRPHSAVPLLVWWGYLLGRSPGGRLTATLTLIAGILVAYLPLVLQAGGLRDYLELLRLKSLYDAEKTPWGGGWSALGDSVRVIRFSLWMGLLVALPFALVGLWRAEREARHFLLLWLVPMLVVGLGMYTTMPGYVLSYLPALALLAGWGIARWRTAPVLIGAIAVINAAVFLATNGPLTREAIQAHDRQLGGRLQEIRARYEPAETILCHRQEWFAFGFRQFQYHLPDYRNVLVTPDASLPGKAGKQMWLGADRQTRFIDAIPAARYVLEINGANGSYQAN
jgi:hypothetical protein